MAWGLAEEAILSYPNVTPLYSGFGFVWYRLWARPFVPDIEAIPMAEKALDLARSQSETSLAEQLEAALAYFRTQRSTP